MKIAVDAMGGDFAPETIVEGAVQAAAEYGFPLILVGQEDRVRAELAKYDIAGLPIEVRHAPEIVTMDDLPSVALRRKKDSSMHVAINMLRSGEADAAVSAGNTGAAMAISKLACRVLDGIDRPALATVLPNISGLTIMIDVGANVDCKPLHLLQFAVMGREYAKVFGMTNPRIGLLSIGEESSKGNVLTKEVFEPLSKSNLNFIGNAEGRDVFNGRVDVIICDGFIGNVVLKVSESLAKTMIALLKEVFRKNWRTKLGYLLIKSEMKKTLTKRVDYEEYGGAPLLGINGVVIISHGSSKAKAMKNAIRVAAESVNHHLNENIVKTLFESEFDLKSRARATALWRQIADTIRHDSDKGKTPADKEKKEKPEVKPPPPSNTPDDKAEEHEAAKKSWWHLKSHKEEVAAEASPEPAPEELIPEEIPLVKESDEPTPDQKAEAAEAAEHEKRRWWQLRQRAEHQKDDTLPVTPIQTPIPLPDQIEQPPLPESEPVVPESPAPDQPDLKSAESHRRSWWKRKETQDAQKALKSDADVNLTETPDVASSHAPETEAPPAETEETLDKESPA